MRPFTCNRVYLGVTFDRSLTSKEHLVKAAKKVNSLEQHILREYTEQRTNQKLKSRRPFTREASEILEQCETGSGCA